MKAFSSTHVLLETAMFWYRKFSSIFRTCTLSSISNDCRYKLFLIVLLSMLWIGLATKLKKDKIRQKCNVTNMVIFLFFSRTFNEHASAFGIRVDSWSLQSRLVDYSLFNLRNLSKTSARKLKKKYSLSIQYQNSCANPANLSFSYFFQNTH